MSPPHLGVTGSCTKHNNSAAEATGSTVLLQTHCCVNLCGVRPESRVSTQPSCEPPVLLLRAQFSAAPQQQTNEPNLQTFPTNSANTDGVHLEHRRRIRRFRRASTSRRLLVALRVCGFNTAARVGERPRSPLPLLPLLRMCSACCEPTHRPRRRTTIDKRLPPVARRHHQRVLPMRWTALRSCACRSASSRRRRHPPPALARHPPAAPAPQRQPIELRPHHAAA